MIPQFPIFKKLEFSDKNEIENFTKNFPPYSDFNFTSMFSWDIKEEMKVSWLNNNLVVRFNNYVSGTPFYSFLGNNNINQTIKDIFSFLELNNEVLELRLIPEVSVRDVDNSKFSVLEDRDHFDYILPANVFRDYNTKKTRDRKISVKKFLGTFSPIKVDLNLSDNKVRGEIYDLFKKWSYDYIDPLEVQNELLALKRFLESDFHENHVCTGVYIEGNLVGFCLTENLRNGYSTIHFCKADKKVSSGLYSYILQENAKTLIEGGNELLNLEQDLGISNIRSWKTSHGIHTFLKKYILRYNKTT